MIPFQKPLYTKWEKDLEKKPRLDIKLDDEEKGDEIIEGLISDSESEESVPSVDSEEERQKFIQSLLPKAPTDDEPVPQKVIYFDDDDDDDDFKYQDESGILTGLLLYPWRQLMLWRERERARRMHYIIVEYERKVKEYETMLQEKARKEIEDNERAVKLEAYRSQQRMIRNSNTVINFLSLFFLIHYICITIT